MFVAIIKRALDPFVALALVSAVEGISLELLSHKAKPSAADLERARAVIASLIALVCAHPRDVP